jgi:phosphate transport system permease protein
VSRTARRRHASTASLVVIYALTAIALVPLALVLWFTIQRGLPSVIHPEFFLNGEKPACEPSCAGVPQAGVSSAIVGTAIMVGLASLMSIPVGILGGIYLAEYGVMRWASWVRLASDVLVGTPSIAIGLFVYAFLVAPLHHYSGASGAVALAILMLPIVVRTTEGAVS